MTPGGPDLSRRDALTVVVGGIASMTSLQATAASGSAAASGPAAASGSAGAPGSTGTAESAVTRARVTVGYETPAGERAARDRATDIVHAFAFDAITVVVDERDIGPLRQLPGVRYVERDRTWVVADQVLPWGIDRVDADAVHGQGKTGERADVAIIDTGIDRGHEDLHANLGDGTGFTGGQQHGEWQDDNGHGTHVAGIAAAVDNDDGVVGLAPHATLHAVKVMTSPGAGLTTDVARGIEWVADRGYDVGNLSLSGDHVQSVADACEYAAEKGVTLVAAAGNGGSCRDCVTYPAAYEEVIAVSATDRSDNLAGYSSRGPEVELAAPGTDIRSTDLGGYSTRSGTSMACPHVAGAAAHLAAGGHSRAEIRRRLRRTAEDVGLSENESGAGLLDVEAALGVASGAGTSGTAGDGDPTPTGTERPTPTETPRETVTPTEAGPSADPPTATSTSASTSTPTSASTSTPTRSSYSPTGPGTPTGPGHETATPTATRTSSGPQPGFGPEGPSGPSPTSSGVRSTPTSGGLTDTVASVWRGTTNAIGSIVDAVVDALSALVPR